MGLLGAGMPRGSTTIYFNYKVNFKDFCDKLCVYSHKRMTQNISDGIFILPSESCPRGGTFRRWGAQGVKKIKHGPVAYQIDGDDEQNRMHVNLSF